MNLKLRRRTLALAVLLGMTSTLAFSKTAVYPDKPVRIVVGFAPGGFTDVLARVIAQKLSQRLGQPVVVENKAGATGTIGADSVAKASADGYTLLLAHFGSNSVAPALYPKLPYDVIQDFTPIVQVGSTPVILTVHPSLPVNSVKDFIAYAKNRPGVLSYASSGKGTAQHLAAVQFMQVTGTQMVHVPYKGSGAAITDLLSGTVNLNFESPPNVLAHIKAAKLKPLAITSVTRSALLPGVPTMDEAGLTGFEMSQWFGVMGPANMPGEITARLNKEINEILRLPDVVEKITSQGGEIIGGGSEQFASFLRTDVAKWARLAKQAPITTD